jgi:hypothetical protein
MFSQTPVIEDSGNPRYGKEAPVVYVDKLDIGITEADVRRKTRRTRG